MPVFRLVAPSREPPLKGSPGEPALGGEPESGKPEGEASLGRAAGDFLPSGPKLEKQLKKKSNDITLIITVTRDQKKSLFLSGYSCNFQVVSFSSVEGVCLECLQMCYVNVII